MKKATTKRSRKSKLSLVEPTPHGVITNLGSADRPEPPPQPHPFPKISICSPLQGEEVGLTMSVRGCAEVDEWNLLSLLVLSNNGRYYPQGDVEVDGEIWHADAQFGNPNTPGHEYTIILVYGARLSLKSYDTIPDGLIRSNQVVVRRPV